MQNKRVPLILGSAWIAVLSAALPAQSEATLWRGGRIHVKPGVVIDGGDILVLKDRIKSVGKALPVEDGATVVDLQGEDVYPGFIDPLNDGLLERTFAGRGAFSPADMTLDGFDVFEATHQRALLERGVLTVGLGTLPAGTRGGVVSVVSVAPSAGAPDVVLKNQFVPCEISAVERVPRAGAQRGFDPFGGGMTLVPATSVMMREASSKAIEELLAAAKRYGESWEKYEKDFAEYEKKLAEWQKNKPAESRPASRPSGDAPERRPEGGGGGRPSLPPEFRNWPREKQREWMRENMGGRRGAAEPAAAESESTPTASGKPKPPEKPRVDHGKAALLRVLKREIPIWIVAHWASDIDMALEIGRSKGVRVVLAGATEAPRRLDVIKEARAIVALSAPFQNEPDSFDRLLHEDDLAGVLARAGIPLTFFTAGDVWLGPAGLASAAALAIGAGLTEDQALAAVTVNAARAIGIEKSLGTIEAGKFATLFTCRGSPFGPGTSALRVMSKGKTVAPRGAGQ